MGGGNIIGRIKSNVMIEKEILKKIFFDSVPQIRFRRNDPFYNSVFDFMYEAGKKIFHGAKLLNISSSKDQSGVRENVYREKFFEGAEITGIDFWHDNFVLDGRESSHKLPFEDGLFDFLITTKYIMEHTTEPGEILKECARVLKKGGEAFIVTSFMNIQHQQPYDFFRMTEFGVAYLAKKAGFSKFTVTPTDGFFYTVPYLSHYFQRSLNLPRPITYVLDVIHNRIIIPVGYFLHKYDNGRGKNLTSHHLLWAKK